MSEQDPAPAPPVDLRLLPAALGAWATAWAVPALPGWCAVLAGATFGALCLGLLLTARRGLRVARPVAAVLVPGLVAALGIAAATAFVAGARTSGAAAGPVQALAAERAVASVELRLTGDPVMHRGTGTAGPRPDLVTVRARAEQVSARGRVTAQRSQVLVLATDPGWASLIPGQELRVSGRFAPARPRSPTVALLRVAGPPPPAAAAPWRDRAAADVRAGLRSAVAGLGPDERGLVPGLTLGDTSGVDPELEEAFRTAGLSHVLVVSGANLAILLGAVLGLARWVGLRLRALPVLALVTVAMFVAVARPEPSLLRASVMGLVGVLGLASGRAGRAAPALCAAVVLLLLIDPWLARSYGFALSVAATAGLIFLAPPWRDRLTRRMPRLLATAIAVPAAAQAACGPVLILLAGEVGLVAVPANLLAVPAVPAAMLLGVLATVSWPICPPLARLFGTLAGVPAWWIVAVARRAAAVPGAALPWPDGLAGALLLAVVTLAAAGWWRARDRPGRPVPGEGGGRARRPSRLLPVVVLIMLGALLLRPSPPLPGPLDALRPGQWPPRGWALVACDVGQGDAAVLRAGPRAAVVVDAGPDPVAVDRCLRRLDVEQVPYALLTHFHSDHVAGLPGVLRGREVAEVGVSPLPEPPAQAAAVRRWAAAAAVPLTHPAPGEVREVGPLRWRVLWPRRLIDEGSAANNASIVLLAETAGVAILLTGDIEPAAQAALRRAEPTLRVDVIKTPHHGSAYQDPGLLAGLGARVAITSVGADNDYGHPARITVDLLRSAGAHQYRTDRDGDVALTVRDGRLGVTARRGPGLPGAGDPVRAVPALPAGPVVPGAWHARRRERQSR